MSKAQQNYSWQKTKVNLAKTAIAQAEREVPHFKAHMVKLDEQVNLKNLCPMHRYQLHINLKNHVSNKGRKELLTNTIILIKKSHNSKNEPQMTKK